MDSVLTVKFKGSRRAYYANPMEFPFRVGDYAVVEVENGEDMGIVTQEGCDVEEEQVAKELRILRKAGTSDIEKMLENRTKEESARTVCIAKVEEHGLNMKVTDIEYQHDRKKLTFYFTADQRVDFRALVKDLAAIYRTRIDLRQIGPRDEAKRHDGCGVCGLRLCCSSWIDSFKPINTQMAKNQDLPINPARLAGVCGRLKCCLRYEYDFYTEAVKYFPDIGAKITTEKGEGVVARIDIFSEVVYVRYDDEKWEMLSLKDIGEVQKGGGN